MGGDAESRTRLSRIARFFPLPRFDEPINPEFIQLTARIRFVALSLLLVTNGLAHLFAEDLALDPDFHGPMQLVNTPILVVPLVLSALMASRQSSTRAMYRMTGVCMVLECVSALLGIWAYGSASNQMIILGVLLVLIYRVAFDFTLGALAFGILLVGHWGIVTAELLDLLPSQPLVVGEPGPAYLPQRHIGNLIVITVMMVTTFWTANWAVARLRHKERAIRILRESLAAAESGRVGRHTGRTLRDTYVVGTLLGSGGMGEVYRGEHRRTKRSVAIKMLHPHLLDDETLLRRFRREAEIPGRLGSEHIVEVIDVDREDDDPFLVLELLEGESLRDRLERAPMSLEDVADLIDQLARGLDVAHRAGVVHRDLKPENVFLCPRPAGPLAKILDFGISKIHGHATALTQEVALLGTPDFMSPEQAIGDIDEVDARADVFALGGLAYFAITGRRPFVAASVPALLRRICDEEPVPVTELRPETPADVADVLTIAMAKTPDQRYERVSDLAADLRAALEGRLPGEVKRRAAAVERGRPATRTVAGDEDISGVADTHVPDDAPTLAGEPTAGETLSRRTR